MKKLFIFLISLTAFMASCNNDPIEDVMEDVDENTNIDLKGEWYVCEYNLGSYGTTCFEYKDKDLNYQELSIKPIENEDKSYSVTHRAKECIDDLCYQDIITRNELKMVDVSFYTWKINGNQIISTHKGPGTGSVWYENLPVAKITKWSPNKFLLITNHISFPLCINSKENTKYQYYYTFKRIK